MSPRRTWLVYGALGLVLWPIPLLNVLQVEAAAVVAFVAYFVSGWGAISAFRAADASFIRVLGREEGALLVPLLMLTASQAWAPNCTYGQGLLFYLLFPGVTVVFAVAVAYALTGLPLGRPRLALCGVGLGVSLLGPLYDLGAHPQFYTYNHVFGGVLGPIYDEQLAVRPGLFAFRGLTLLWAACAGLAGRLLRGQGGGGPLVGLLAVVAGVYWGAVPLGINTSESHLQRHLEGHVRTEHFDVYYDSTRQSRRAAEALAADHEAHYAELHRRLGLADGAGPDRIQSYLYPNPDVKARLTGARTTSVAPVWLGTPQVHLLVQRAEASLGHELAHVFSRPYGLPGLKASWSPGLVEGWAVALEPPAPYPSAHDLVRVATATDTTEALALTADAVAQRLTSWGFWTGRGAVSYAAMGSFVRYLLERYGPARLRAVYAWGNFEAVYGRSLQNLATAWAQSVDQAPMVARAAHDVVSRQFVRPSLFEQECPHHLPPARRHLQAARRAARRDDSSRVAHHLQAALAEEPRYGPAHAELARRRLAAGRAATVRRQLDTLAAARRSPRLLRLRADAHAMGGGAETARRLYRRARARLPLYAHAGRTRLLLRTAVAGRPGVVRTLTSGIPPARQARRLAADTTATVQVWRALRLHDGHRYAQADVVWQRLGGVSGPDWPRSDRQAWALQRRAWAGEAALRAGRPAAAVRGFRAAARGALRHGAEAWARALEAWARRGERALSGRAQRPGPQDGHDAPPIQSPAH
jgi:hypothetical protein